MTAEFSEAFFEIQAVHCAGDLIPMQSGKMHFDNGTFGTCEAAFYWVRSLVCQGQDCQLWLIKAAHHLLPDSFP